MATLKNNRYVADWGKFNLPPIPDNADELIAEAVETMRNGLRKSNFGDVFESDRIENYRNTPQLFAVFGYTAYELCNWALVDEESGREYAWRPATLNGKAFQSCPEEGRGGVLHWVWSSRCANKWDLTWFTASGWIYTSELDQTPAEIGNNICAEIDAGQTPLTGNNSKPEYQ
jgi:hypothetical protein